MLRQILSFFSFLLAGTLIHAVVEVPVGPGYCHTSVNAAVFRGSALVSDNRGNQYVSYYAPDGHVMLGKRTLGDSQWQIVRTPYSGNVADAHNVISIGVDGNGCLHMSFDHHGHPLRYCKATAPGSLEMGPLESMTGIDESDVTYPEFYSLPGGDLLFAYRSGASGRGNLVLKRYDTENSAWTTVQQVLIDGENERNAYWQLFVDDSGRIHLSWVWRETWLVETNHDVCYACSDDGGKSWKRSDGSSYTLPITAGSAEIAWHVPQNSELINQTGMTADKHGRPYIATYWRDADSSVPQYRLVWHDGGEWHMSTVGQRTEPFSLSGGGTKMIPISRPRIASDGKRAWYLMRDSERGSRVSLAYTEHLGKADWEIRDLTQYSVDAWEPNFDINLWNRSHKLHVFVQTVHQGDGETMAGNDNSTMVSVLEIDPDIRYFQ